MPKFKNDRIGLKVNSNLKEDLTLLADYNKRSLSNFISLELEKIVEREENQEILKKMKKIEQIEISFEAHEMAYEMLKNNESKTQNNKKE